MQTPQSDQKMYVSRRDRQGKPRKVGLEQSAIATLTFCTLSADILHVSRCEANQVRQATLDAG